MNDFNRILSKFSPITLDEMNKVKLLDRIDRKYMFHADMLESILELARRNYYTLEIENKRFACYQTTYFDTPDYQMYLKHHDGKLNRYKVRFRTYLDSGLNFFEIKIKTNTGRTKKSRVQLYDKISNIDGVAANLLERKTDIKADTLTPALTVNYNRITLVSKDLSERLTIDFDMCYEHENGTQFMHDLVIAEVKQDKSGSSPFIDIMSKMRIKDASMSKYCLGVALLVDTIKHNNFKTKIRYVNQLLSKSA
jgi:hypothetical protein